MPKSKIQISNKIIWHLDFVIWNLFVIWILLFGILFVPSQMHAQSEIILSKQLTKSDLQSGYTMEADTLDLRITIAPNQSNRSAFAEIIKPDYYPAIPLDKDLASNIYNYSILPATDNLLPFEIEIAMNYPAQEARYKEIFIYNQKEEKWQNLSGDIDYSSSALSVRTNLASGFIAVFADHLDKSEYLKQSINSESILAIDAKTGEILVERESEKPRPIASLTKLMTVAVFLDNNPGWEKKITITDKDDAIPSKIYVNPGDALTVKDLFYATLLKSANNATKALARSTGLSDEEFVEKMNQKAKNLGMKNSRFVEPTGLSNENVSTARDLMILSKNLFSSMIILQATTPKKISIKTTKGKKILLENSNKLIDMPYTLLGSKTGFTYEAGRCLTMKVKNKKGSEALAITLGADNPGAQWEDMRILLDAILK